MVTRLGVAAGIPTCCMLLALPGCALLPRYESIDKGPTPYSIDRLADELDPWLLADGLGDGLIVEIDWVEGCKPGPRTLRGFERVLHRYVPASRQIEIVLDDEIPLVAWDDNIERAGHDATIQRLVEVFAGTVARPEPGVEKRYVLFVPERRGSYGVSQAWEVERNERTILVQGVIVAREAHERSAKLWLSRDRFERGTLIHEFGHQFGLVTNDLHERVHPHMHHCTGLKCLMALPTPRVIVRNAPLGLFNRFPLDYCRRCQEDIRRAQAYWRQQMETDPDYAASLERKREVRDIQANLNRLARSERHEEVLEQIRELRARFPDEAGWAGTEARALAALGRYEEALACLLTNLESDPDDPRYWRQRQQAGRILVGFGRHDEAVELFDRALMRSADPYQFEQSTWVLRTALVGEGRYAEAAELIEELLARGHEMSFARKSMAVGLAAYMRLAGMLDEADERVTKGLRDRKYRVLWLQEARTLRLAQGRTEEARDLLFEMRDNAERGFLDATEPRKRWGYGWTSIPLLAESGELEKARARAHELDSSGDPDGTRPPTAMTKKTPAWMALGELDRAAELVEALSINERGLTDPCGMKTLEPLRRSRDHSHLFECCPVRSHDP